MDFKKACNILELNDKQAQDTRELRKKYYSLALKYHPDKYKIDDGECFRKIQSAYDYLNKYNNIEIFPNENSSDYMSILNKFIKLFSPSTNWDSLFMDTTFTGILKDCETITLDIFDNISKEKSIEVYTFLKKFKSLFHLSDELLQKMCEKVHKKMKNDNLIILNPTINDILEDNIYKYEIHDKTFYVPLWCNEIEYSITETKDIIIKCICELDPIIDIDKHNNIIYNFKGDIKNVLREKSIQIIMGNKKLQIPTNELLIKDNQIYVFEKQGMLRLNVDNIYDTGNRGDIIVNINLT
jgi:hypothetical protein